MKRYVGRATGLRRKGKKYRFLSLTTLILATVAMAIALAVVLILKPNSDIPGKEKGSASPLLVLPTNTSPPVSKPSGSTSKPEVRKTKTVTPTAKPTVPSKPKPTPVTPTPVKTTPPPKLYTFVVLDSKDTICKREEPGRRPQTAVRYFSWVNDQNPDNAFGHAEFEVPNEFVDCPTPTPPPPPPVEPDPPPEEPVVVP